jgi:hypothetical protein
MSRECTEHMYIFTHLYALHNISMFHFGAGNSRINDDLLYAI